MKQWNGLLKKEWVLMRKWLYGTALIGLLFMLVVPFAFSLLTIGKIKVAALFGLVIMTWILISLFLPGALLLNSLRKEWKRPDLWLHSTSSIFKLFGVKSVFSATIGAMNVFVPTLLFLIYALIYGSPFHELSFNEFVVLTSLLALSFYAVSIMIMCIGLFILVFSRVIRPFAKGFTIPIMVMLFFFVAWVFERLKGLAIYQKVVGFGPIGNPVGKEIYIERENFYIGPVEPVIYTGDIFVSLLFTGFLFVSASILFEKKVRL